LCWGAGPLAKGHRDYVVPFSFFRQTSSRRGKTLRSAGGSQGLKVSRSQGDRLFDLSTDNGEAVRIDLNADVGEGATEAALEAELALIPHLTSVNVACGGHAGDRDTMARTIRAASVHGVSVGAHPGYIDRQTFGRRPLALPHEVVRAMVAEQVAALIAAARAQHVRVTHVKPHGALYNQAASDLDLALAVAEAVREQSTTLCFVGLAGSALLEAGRRAGLPVAAEAFVDRAYTPEGSLVPRTEPGAVLEGPEAAVRQALAIVRGHYVNATDGSRIAIDADTLCLHGDTTGALAIAKAVRHALEAAHIRVVALHDPSR
jgi:5-oxoprolinase (ATP-hydrolysing) subunit A